MSIPEISVGEAIARVVAGSVLIDVREQDEWDGGHAPTAILLPMSAIRDRLSELPGDAELLIICHSGGRSSRVTRFLIDDGRSAINVEGGMMAWSAAGGPVAIDAG